MANRQNSTTIYFAWEKETPFFKIGTTGNVTSRINSLYKNHGYNRFKLICTGFHSEWEYIQNLEQDILRKFYGKRKDTRYQTTIESYKKLDGSIATIERTNKKNGGSDFLQYLNLREIKNIRSVIEEKTTKGHFTSWISNKRFLSEGKNRHELSWLTESLPYDCSSEKNIMKEAV
jgi:hypothetical protein